jgi:hypothetical protein
MRMRKVKQPIERSEGSGADDGRRRSKVLQDLIGAARMDNDARRDLPHNFSQEGRLALVAFNQMNRHIAGSEEDRDRKTWKSSARPDVDPNARVANQAHQLE